VPLLRAGTGRANPKSNYNYNYNYNYAKSLGKRPMLHWLLL
jgi:hypothetical protein